MSSLLKLKEKTNILSQYVKHSASYEMDYPLTYPTEINFQMTGNCNIRCAMCQIPQNADNNNLLSVAEMKRVLNEARGWDDSVRYVSFVGGEALLRKNETLTMIRFAKELGFHTSLVSNGTLISENVADQLCEAGLDRIAISIDGGKKESHDFIRGNGIFDRAIDGLDRLILRRDDGIRLKVDISSTIMAYNFREMELIHKLAIDHKVNELFFQSVVPDNTFVFDDPAVYNTPLWIQPGEIQELMEIIERIIELKRRFRIINNST